MADAVSVASEYVSVETAPSGACQAVFGASLLVYLMAAMISSRRDRSMLALSVLVGVLGSVGVFFLRSGLGEVSLRGSLRTASILNVAILVCSRGRPGTLFDVDQPKAKTLRRMSKAERASIHERGRNAVITQGLLLLFIIVGSGVYVFSGWTFLD